MGFSIKKDSVMPSNINLGTLNKHYMVLIDKENQFSSF